MSHYQISYKMNAQTLALGILLRCASVAVGLMKPFRLGGPFLFTCSEFVTGSMNITIRVLMRFVLQVLGAFCHRALSVNCACRDAETFVKGRLVLLTWPLNSESGLHHLPRNAML